MARIIFEHEFTLEDLAETINDQMDRPQLMTFLEKISGVVDDPDFDEAARDLFSEIYNKWS